MYSVIESHRDAILGKLTTQEVNEYDLLIEMRDQSASPEYQRRYRSFWGMNAARLGTDFYSQYFAAFKPSLAAPRGLGQLSRALYDAYARRDGSRTMQFSFTTKLMHTLNPKLPIYDSRVAMFYLFQEPSTGLTPEERLEKLLEFHRFLEGEYERVIREGLLASAIASFRHRFNPRQHTDEKIIDWLIWAFADMAGRGSLMRGEIT